MTQECGNIKSILAELQNLELSSTARLIAVLEACGITDRETIEKLTASKPSTVREARRTLEIQRQKSSGDGNPAPEIQRSAGNPAPAPEIQRQKSSALACADIATRATKESSSEVSEVSEVSEDHLQISKTAEPKCSPRGARLEKNWVLPDDWMKWTRVTFPHTTADMVTSEAATFADYWNALPGSKACKLDWEATWRNWCRRSLSRGPVRPGAFNQPPPAKSDARMVLERRMARAAAEVNHG